MLCGLLSLFHENQQTLRAVQKGCGVHRITSSILQGKGRQRIFHQQILQLRPVQLHFQRSFLSLLQMEADDGCVLAAARHPVRGDQAIDPAFQAQLHPAVFRMNSFII